MAVAIQTMQRKIYRRHLRFNCINNSNKFLNIESICECNNLSTYLRHLKAPACNSYIFYYLLIFFVTFQLQRYKTKIYLIFYKTTRFVKVADAQLSRSKPEILNEHMSEVILASDYYN